MDGDGLQMMARAEHTALPGRIEEPVVIQAEAVPPSEQIARYLEEMRRITNEAADVAREGGEGELYCRFKAWVGEMDGLRVVLSEKEGEK